MKKALLLALSCLYISIAARGQQYEYGPPVPINDAPANKLKFGVFFAPNISWMKPTSNKSDDRSYSISNEGSTMGFTWGLMADYFFSENYGIATGFQLNNTGGSILSVFNTSATPPSGAYVRSADFDYRLQFLEVPFALKLRSDELKGGFKIFGQIGLTLGVNIGKKASYEVIYYDGTTEKTSSGDKEKLTGDLPITPALLQLNVGAGVEYPISEKLSFYTGLFFNNGFAPDVTNPREYSLDYQGSFSDGNIRLNNFALRIGLFF